MSKRKKKKEPEGLPGSNQKMCLRKTIFWTEFGALFAAKRITEEGTPMKVYRCPNCLQWHLAGKKKKEKEEGSNSTLGNRLMARLGALISAIKVQILVSEFGCVCSKNGVVAQLVEHLTCTQEVEKSWFSYSISAR